MTVAALIEQTPITQAWTLLGGGELRRGRGQAFWRRGDGWSVSLNDDRGAWYDHRDGIGGGVLNLIQQVRGGSRGEAARWLADLRGATLDNSPWSQEDRRRYAERRRVASVTAGDIANWRDVLIPELNARKLAAVEAGDFEALRPAAKLCRVLEHGTPADIARAYARHRAADPEGVTRLIAEGRKRHAEVRNVTWDAVIVLAMAEDLHAA
jgi:hypothetical protein